MSERSMPKGTSKDEFHLSQLAMRFRGTREIAERKAIAAEYAQTVKKLIKRGQWLEMPPPEDQLPDDWMPDEYFDFWASGEPTGQEP